MTFLEAVDPFLVTTTSDPVVEFLSNDTFNNSINSTDIPPHCIYYEPPLTEIRFWIVTVFGTTVSIISVSENLFLFFLLLSR